MQLIAPDILTEAHGLSLPFGAAGLFLGLALFAFGWRWHRFWVVLATTVTAGLIGMSGHPAMGPRMLAAGLLLAIAAGMLAIDLSRLLAFAAGGATAWFIVHHVLPTFREPMISFLLGGIFGLILYRLQLMILTSVAGTLLAGHSLLLVVEKLSEHQFDAAFWVRSNILGLNIAVLVVSLLGVAVQGQIERWHQRAKDRRSWFMTFFAEPAAPESAPKSQSWLAGLLRRPL